MHEAVDAFMAVEWAAFEDEVPKPYQEPDGWSAQCPAPTTDTVER